MDELLRTEHRCECGRFLFRGLLLKDEIEIKCSRCNKLHFFPGLSVQGKARLFAVLSDTNGVIVNASASVKTVFGKSISQLVGTAVSDIFSSEKDATSDFQIAKLASKHKYLRLAASINTKKTDNHCVKISYVNIKKQNKDFVLRAVSDRSVIEVGQLKKLGFAGEDICPLICEADGKGLIQYLDGDVEGMFGYLPEEVLGRHVSNFIGAEEVDVRAKNRDFLAHRELTYRQKDHSLITKDGKKLFFEIHSTPLHDHTGEFIGYKNMVWPK